MISIPKRRYTIEVKAKTIKELVEEMKIALAMLEKGTLKESSFNNDTDGS